MEIKGRFNQRGVAVLRVAVGIIFLWAGLEKLLAPQAFDASGFLKFATAGSLGWPFVSGEIAEGTVFNPTNGFWVALAGNPTAMGIINAIVPFGQVGIGISLVLGLFTRFAGVMGALMMLFFFVAAWDFKYGVVNQHLTYALVCATLVGLGAGRYYGLDGMIADRVSPAIRNLLMSGRPVPATA